MEQVRLSRRGLMGAAAGSAAAAAAVGALGPAAAGAGTGRAGARRRAAEDLVPRQNIGIQLYSLRDMAGADLPGTLTMLADVGYPEVELFQLHGRTAPELRALLDERGLRAIAAHVPINRWRTELDTVLTEAETLGMTYVGLPGIFPAIAAEVTAYRALAREMNRYAAAAADRGLRFYYHNHDWEFARDRGQVLYDVLLDQTDPDLVFFELDLYWIVTAGMDPLDYLGRYDQSRWPLFHVKDRSPRSGSQEATFADLGEGVIRFERIFRELENKHYHHFLVERDTQPDPARTARVGYEYLRGLRGRRRRRPSGPAEAGMGAGGGGGDADADAARRT
jgi:sugar phosphate isomerase/epimerase